MMERAKSVLLGLLVALSLVQSYFLAYSMPSLEAKVKTEQNYVQTDPLGPEEKVENLIFPEQIILHLGEDRHTAFYPDTAPYYDLILKKLQGRKFSDFQRSPDSEIDWDRVRRDNQGMELRFGRPIPFALLQRVFQIDDDFLFSRDSIDRIWIFVRQDSKEVRAFFFSADGLNVYESLRVDLSIVDMETNVGFGQYWTPYRTLDGELYWPERTYGWVTELKVPITRFTTEQMQRNLFFDPSITKAIPERKEGNLIYTDGKRGLKVEQGGGWMSYTDPVAPTEGQNDLIDNVTGAVQFVNQHGGWNGQYRLTLSPLQEGDGVIRFQQYYNKVPIAPGSAMTFGYMQLRLQQGTVTSYARSLLLLGEKPEDRRSRVLPGGDPLRSMIDQASVGSRALSLYPAYRPVLDGDAIVLHPVWVVRLADGTTKMVAESVSGTSASP